MPQKKLPEDTGEILQLRDQGWTIEQIAEHYGASQQGVHYRLQKAGATKPAPKYGRPWTVKTEHDYATPSVMVRAYLRRESGGELDPTMEKRLDNWIAELDRKGLVLDYHEDCPPHYKGKVNGASPATGGWHYMPRTPRDGTGPLRYPDVDDAEEPERQQTRATRAMQRSGKAGR